MDCLDIEALLPVKRRNGKWAGSVSQHPFLHVSIRNHRMTLSLLGFEAIAKRAKKKSNFH